MPLATPQRSARSYGKMVELAIEAALQQKAALEMVRSGRARQLLAQRGPMAALFRW